MISSESEFNRSFSLEKVGHQKLNHSIEATPQECTDLAKRFDLIKLENFKTDFQLHKIGKGETFFLTGTLNAVVTQECIVTLESVTNSICLSFEVVLRDKPIEEITELELTDADEMDEDYYEDMKIDLGEIAAQYLFMALDPYPRSSKAPPLSSEAPKEEIKKKVSPFAVLKNLTSKQPS